MPTRHLTATIQSKILFIRGHKVMLDRHLACLYAVGTRALNRAVQRNLGRFPSDFMFRLSRTEWDNLNHQIGVSSWGGDRRALPRAFTEQGVAMLSSVLRSPRAVRVNIEIMRAFVRLRRLLLSNEELARRLADLERRHEGKFKVVFETIRRLMAQPDPPRKRIGFRQ
jgi:hypothetical protein